MDLAGLCVPVVALHAQYLIYFKSVEEEYKIDTFEGHST